MTTLEENGIPLRSSDGGVQKLELDSLDGEKGQKEQESEDEEEVAKGAAGFMQKFAEARDAPFV